MIPSDLASLVACHEARDYTASKAVGDPVSQLLGKYSTPNGVVQATSGKRPTYQENDLGYAIVPSLLCDGVDDELVFDSSTTLAGPYTIFHVYAPRADALDSFITLHGEPVGWADSWRMLWTYNLGGVYQANAYPTSGSENNQFGLGTAAGNLRIHCVTMGTPFTVGLKYYIDNILRGSSGDATGPGVLRLAPGNCDWYATIAFNAILDSTQRAGIFSYITKQVLLSGYQRLTQVAIEPVYRATSAARLSQFAIEVVRRTGIKHIRPPGGFSDTDKLFRRHDTTYAFVPARPRR